MYISTFRFCRGKYCQFTRIPSAYLRHVGWECSLSDFLFVFTEHLWSLEISFPEGLDCGLMHPVRLLVNSQSPILPLIHYPTENAYFVRVGVLWVHVDVFNATTRMQNSGYYLEISVISLTTRMIRAIYVIATVRRTHWTHGIGAILGGASVFNTSRSSPLRFR